MLNVGVFDIWEYFKRNSERLLEYEQLVAQNDESGETIYVSREGERMIIMVYDEFENPISEYEATDHAEAVDAYSTVLSQIGISGDGDSLDEDQEEIKKNEARLDDAAVALIYEIGGDDLDLIEDFDLEQATKAVKEICCELLAKQFGCPVYRPMMLKKGDGTEFYSEYPYAELT